MTVSSSASDDTSSESSSTSSASSDEEEEQWSLRVRLLSAVDLPPSLSPTVPLCPWFKFGLVEDIVAALESTDADNNVDVDEHYQQNTVDDQQNNRHSRTILPRRNEHEHSHEQGDSDVMKPKKFTSNTSTSSIANINSRMNNPIDHLLTHQIHPSQQRTSSSKLMSKSTNGGGGNGADWNEEYRWDALQTPMESALVVQLCTRLAIEDTSYTMYKNDNSFYGRRIVLSSSGAGASSAMASAIGSDDHDLNSSNASASDHNISNYSSSSQQSEEMSQSQLTSGIRGLWRKGKEQYVEHIIRNKGVGGGHGVGAAVVTQKEQQAANVAQFLMNSGDDNNNLQQQDDLVEYQQKWSERKTHSHSGVSSGSGLDHNNEGSAVKYYMTINWVSLGMMYNEICRVIILRPLL